MRIIPLGSFVAFGLALLLPVQGYAESSCGQTPPSPAQLFATNISYDDAVELNHQFGGYLESINNYISCLDEAVIDLNPDAENYDDQFSALIQQREAIAEAKRVAIDRYNYLIQDPE